MEYTIPTDDEKRLIESLKDKQDTESLRVKRYLSMPDLSRTDGSPLKEIVKKITSISDFKNFDLIRVPEIVPTSIAFDLFDFAPDHPARSKSDTYYVDETNILRTHTTVMWYYYLSQPEIKKRLANGESLGSLSFG